MTITEVITAEIGAISAVFSSYSPDSDRFCATELCQKRFLETDQRLVNTGSLVALYVTLEREHGNDDPCAFGRIIALARPQPMLPGRTIDYYRLEQYQILKRSKLEYRWPIGWPSEVVFYSPYGGPDLKIAYYKALGRSDYADFTSQLQWGPISLSTMAMRPLRDGLMEEIRHQIERDHRTQLRTF
jgi:hypothetical protein